MSDGSRALPGRPNLRYLRLEAKRPLAAGEFATLHDAQTAIAREHGQPSWAALRQLVQAGPLGLRGSSFPARPIPVNSVGTAPRGAWTNPEE